MKIVIPTDSQNGIADKVADHFGRCKTYTFLNEKKWNLFSGGIHSDLKCSCIRDIYGKKKRDSL